MSPGASPHFYRRVDLPDVLVATSPYSDADAAKRIVGAGKPLKEAGIPIREGLAEVAAQLREVVRSPAVKGEVSTRLTPRLTEPYRRNCVSCGAVHAWEVPFRIGALYAGLELEAGTSPPVLRLIPGWPDRAPGPAPDPTAAPERLQPLRAYLRFLGPATPQEVAKFLDGALADVKRHWPTDAVEVDRDKTVAWELPGAPAAAGTDGVVRLLGPFDLLLQGQDRELLVPDHTRHKVLWPVLGRPGAVLVGTDIAGLWRPRASGRKLTVRLHLWTRLGQAALAQIEGEAERLAQHRGVTLAGIERE